MNPEVTNTISLLHCLWSQCHSRYITGSKAYNEDILVCFEGRRFQIFKRYIFFHPSWVQSIISFTHFPFMIIHLLYNFFSCHKENNSPHKLGTCFSSKAIELLHGSSSSDHERLLFSSIFSLQWFPFQELFHHFLSFFNFLCICSISLGNPNPHVATQQKGPSYTLFYFQHF